MNFAYIILIHKYKISTTYNDSIVYHFDTHLLMPYIVKEKRIHMSNRLSVIDATNGKPIKSNVQITRYRASLDTYSDVKKEMAKIYRETRTGLLESTEATKLTWMLQAIQKVIESTDMESRLKVLEDERVD